MSINVVTISGRLTRDPELRYTPSGAAVCNLGLAHNERFKQQDGTYREQVHFVDCNAWNGFGELCARKLRKGSFVTLSGKLQYREWEAQDGSKRSKLELRVTDAVGEAFFQTDGQSAPTGEETPAAADDDIPF